MIRGLGVGETSKRYAAGYEQDWSGATFKVTGVIMNGKTDLSAGSENRIPVRWFVFEDDPANFGTADADFIYSVDVANPFSTESPGYWDGWKDYKDTSPSPGFGWSWALDMRRKPYTVEILKRENTLE